jgi:hypothetical protein
LGWAEEGGSRVQSQPRLHNKYNNKKKKKKEKRK